MAAGAGSDASAEKDRAWNVVREAMSDREPTGREGEYRRYRRTAIAEMADYYPGFDMTGVSVSEADELNGSPKVGDKIARNPKNHSDRWLVSAEYFHDNFAALEDPEEGRADYREVVDILNDVWDRKLGVFAAEGLLRRVFEPGEEGDG